MPQVHVIEPIYSHEPAKLRVCAYARVSSDSADQLNSFAAQVRYYTNLIAGNEDWMLVDIYADRGITGTSTAKRTEFRRMMEDCRKGKIDRILVKSLSRFARNTQDCIAALRELRQLGVTVVFEKEHINTGTMANEMLISMMSAFAQEESVSISKNMRKGAVMRMQNGTFRISMPPYGYRYDASGILAIEPSEAAIVQEIFAAFLSGTNLAKIAEDMQMRGVPKLRGECKWSKHGIRYILTNERYMGDQRFRKSFRTDTLPYKKVDNRGQMPQFYMAGSHPAIIGQEVFEKAQTLLAQHGQQFGHDPVKHDSPWTGMLYCAVCGAPLYHRLVNGRECWACSRHLKDRQSCALPTVAEKDLVICFYVMLEKLQQNSCGILEDHFERLEQIQERLLVSAPGRTGLQLQMADLLSQSHTLSRLLATGCVDSAFFIAQNNGIQKKLAEIKDAILQQQCENNLEEEICRTRDLIASIQDIQLSHKTNALLGPVITKAVVKDSGVIFTLVNGLEFEERWAKR